MLDNAERGKEIADRNRDKVMGSHFKITDSVEKGEMIVGHKRR